MKKYIFLLMLVSSASYGQLSIDEAIALAREYRIGSYYYMEQFSGHFGYGAPVILTADKGAAIFGDTGDESGSFGLLVRFDSTGAEAWSRKIRQKGSDMESQVVVEDARGNYYVFIISYERGKYRGGSERVVHIRDGGEILWEKMLGNLTLLDNPVVAYVKALDGGRIEMRGHVVIEKPVEGKDPVYQTWTAWLDSEGHYSQEIGEQIDWSGSEWKDRLKPMRDTIPGKWQ